MTQLVAHLLGWFDQITKSCIILNCTFDLPFQAVILWVVCHIVNKHVVRRSVRGSCIPIVSPSNKIEYM